MQNTRSLEPNILHTSRISGLVSITTAIENARLTDKRCSAFNIYLNNVHISHTSLHDGLLSRLWYLSAGCGDNGVPKGTCSLKASPTDDSGVTSVVSCSSTSPASETPPALDVLTSGSERTPHSTLHFGLGTWEVSYVIMIFLALPRA